MTRWRLSPTATGGLVGLLAGLVALGPALRPGYLLAYDMVFVPSLALNNRTLGIDGSVPRAVPNDLVVAVLSTVAPGWVVQKLLLLAVFVGVGAGVGHLLSTRLAAVAASLFACWNPYLMERLAIGHWGFLLGYATIPWVAGAAARFRSPHGRLRLTGWLLVAALCGSTSAVIAALVAVCVYLFSAAGRRPTRGDWGLLAGWLVVVNAAWWFPFLFLSPRDSADPEGVLAFMARADTPWGTILSVVSGGGIWNKATWPAERETWVVSGLFLAWVLVVLAAAVVDRSWRRHPALPGLAVAGAVGLLVAIGSAVPALDGAVTWLVVNVPGAGLVRDSQKLVAPWVITLAVAVGLAVERLAGGVGAASRLPARRVWVVGAVALPVLLLPSLAWGGMGRWEAVAYPDHVRAAAALLDDPGTPEGMVASFPWTLYRRYDWNGDRVVLDPWQRLLAREVLVNDDLPLSDRTVDGESEAARQVQSAVARGTGVVEALSDAGVRFAVVDLTQPRGAEELGLLSPPAEQIFSESGIVIVDLGPPSGATGSDPPWWAWLGLGATVAAALAWLGALGFRLRRHPLGLP